MTRVEKVRKRVEEERQCFFNIVGVLWMLFMFALICALFS